VTLTGKIKMELIKKITSKTVGYDKPYLQTLFGTTLAKDGDTIAAYKVVGIVSDIRPGQSDFGPYAKFIGEFVCTTENGEQFQSGTALLPTTIADLLQGAVMQAREKQQSVEFGCAIGVKRDSTSATGYVFTAQPLMEFKSSDRMGNLLHKLGMQPALTALPGGRKDEMDPDVKAA